MKNFFLILLFLAGLSACKKESASEKNKDCAAFEVINNTGAAIDPLTYINSCGASYIGPIPPGGSGYLTGDQISLQQANGIVWEKLRELPVPVRKSVQTYVPELGIFTSTPTTDGNSFSPSLMTNIYSLEIRYWDTSRIKHEVMVSVEGGLPKNVNATVVINATLEDGTPKTINATFEDGRRLLFAQKVDVPVARVRAHWRFWKYKYQNGERVKVNGKYVTEPLGEIEQVETFTEVLD